jgi:hypothetical protein
MEREMFNANCFTYGINQSLSDTVITPVLAVARAAVIGWDTCYALATHKRTITAVKLTCWFIYVAAIYAWAIGRTAGILARHWADGLVNECLEDEPTPAPVVEVATVESEIVLDIQPGYGVTTHRTQCEVMPAPKAPAKEPTLAQLSKHCIEHNKSLPAGDSRRIARAGHLNRAQALAALGRI